MILELIQLMNKDESNLPFISNILDSYYDSDRAMKAKWLLFTWRHNQSHAEFLGKRYHDVYEAIVDLDLDLPKCFVARLPPRGGECYHSKCVNHCKEEPICCVD